MLTKIRTFVKRLLLRRKSVDDSLLLNDRAATVKDFFQNYPYIVEWHEGKDIGSAASIYDYACQARLWCVEHCNEKNADNVLEVIKDSENTDYQINTIAGEQVWFWAFKDEEDAFWFSLRW